MIEALKSSSVHSIIFCAADVSGALHVHRQRDRVRDRAGAHIYKCNFNCRSNLLVKFTSVTLTTSRVVGKERAS
jgi:hypothetical protein